MTTILKDSLSLGYARLNIIALDRFYIYNS
jgi:hypothetical protein